ncbi:hypothetical protein BaRGS_00003464 [Batillaria attramentaria]|uniref:Uncharacterized protein n=1 Tax=Batillaria attramentaria TaxID=370345 RepID=A0ABD0M270_9CAEN
MKFRQRQILLTFALLSIGIFLLNHRLLSGRPAVSTLSVDPPLPDSNLHPQPEAALRSLPKDSAKPTTTALDKLSSASSSYDVKYVQRASSARCPKLLRPVGVRDVQTFQQVDGGTGTYVFSAFLDREDKIVRVVALNSLRNKSAFCLLWYENGTRDLDVVAARIQLLPESHGRR